MLQTNFAVYIGIVYSYLPFMILPLYSNLEKHDQTADRGGGRSGCAPVHGLSADHAAAIAARHHCRLAARVHSRGGRVRDSLAAGPHRSAHDRPRAVG